MCLRMFSPKHCPIPQTLPQPNPFDTTDDPIIHTAHKLCLHLEALQQEVQKTTLLVLICARFLGYMLIEAPTDPGRLEFATEVMRHCTDDMLQELAVVSPSLACAATQFTVPKNHSLSHHSTAKAKVRHQILFLSLTFFLSGSASRSLSLHNQSKSWLALLSREACREVSWGAANCDLHSAYIRLVDQWRSLGRANGMLLNEYMLHLFTQYWTASAKLNQLKNSTVPKFIGSNTFSLWASTSIHGSINSSWLLPIDKKKILSLTIATSVSMQRVRESRIFRERRNTSMRSCRIWKRPGFWQTMEPWRIGWCIVPRIASPPRRWYRDLLEKCILLGLLLLQTNGLWLRPWMTPISNFPYVMHYYQHRLHRLTFLYSKHHGYLLRILIL